MHHGRNSATRRARLGGFSLCPGHIQDLAARGPDNRTRWADARAFLDEAMILVVGEQGSCIVRSLWFAMSDDVSDRTSGNRPNAHKSPLWRLFAT